MKYNILSVVGQIYTLLNSRERKGFLEVLLLVLMQSFIEVFGLAMVLPFLYIAQDPGKIETNDLIHSVYTTLSFSSHEWFIGAIAFSLIFAFIIKSVFGLWVVKIQTGYSLKIAHSMMDRQVDNVLKKDYLYFKRHNSNKLVQDMATIPIEFASLIIQPTLMIFSEFAIGLLICIGVALYNVNILIGLILVLAPPIVLFYRLARRRIGELGIEKNEIRPKAYKYLFGAIHGIESVKISHSENFFKKKMLQSFGQLFDKMRKLVVFESIPIRIIEVAAISAVCLLVVYSLFWGGSSTELIPLLVIFATAAYRLMPSLNRVVASSIKMRGASYIFKRLKEEPAAKQHRADFENPAYQFEFKQQIAFNQITYRYPGNKEDTLKNLSFEIAKGESIGIIGKSGEGKSTLLRVFLKLLESDSGSLIVDGKPITYANNYWWQEKVGYVEQSTYLLDGTVEENIAFGEHKIDEERVRKCLEMASLTKVVEALPLGQKSGVGEFGGSMSGGQQQRLAIARALYRNVEILVFDEATSALDVETEASIVETLSHLKSTGLTIVVVSHRVNSLSSCDRVIEIKDGEISETFSYKELLKNS